MDLTPSTAPVLPARLDQSPDIVSDKPPVQEIKQEMGPESGTAPQDTDTIMTEKESTLPPPPPPESPFIHPKVASTLLDILSSLKSRVSSERVEFSDVSLSDIY